MGMNNPLKYFAELRDLRVERTREHLLRTAGEVVAIDDKAMCGTRESGTCR